jgi:hypothetical protein
MKVPVCFIVLICSWFACGSCNKDNAPKTTCDTNAPTERTLTSKAATVKEIAGKFYIIEQNTIDVRLLPCNLDASFAIDNLQVIVSGEVKQTKTKAGEPCCTNNFIINNITR